MRFSFDEIVASSRSRVPVSSLFRKFFQATCRQKIILLFNCRSSRARKDRKQRIAEILARSSRSSDRPNRIPLSQSAARQNGNLGR